MHETWWSYFAVAQVKDLQNTENSHMFTETCTISTCYTVQAQCIIMTYKELLNAGG